MIALYIILGILFLLFLITLISIRVHALYDEELRLYVGALFVKIQLVPPKPKKEKKKPKEKKKKQKKQKKKPKEEKPKKEKSFDLKGFIQEKGVTGLLNIVSSVAKLTAGTLKDFLGKIVVTKLVLSLKIAGDDAADSAVKYGRTCAVLYPALKVIGEVMTVKSYDVDVEPDFSEEPKTSAKAEVKAKIRIISILAVVLKRGIQALRLLIKLRIKKS